MLGKQQWKENEDLLVLYYGWHTEQCTHHDVYRKREKTTFKAQKVKLSQLTSSYLTGSWTFWALLLPTCNTRRCKSCKAACKGKALDKMVLLQKRSKINWWVGTHKHVHYYWILVSWGKEKKFAIKFWI